MNTLLKVSNADVKPVSSKKVTFPKIDLKKLLLSPSGATIFPIVVLMSALFFPPILYEYYVGEPDYVFLNFSVAFYVLICLVFYYLGVRISNFKSTCKVVFFKRKIVLSPFIHVGMIAILTIALNLLFIAIFNLYFSRATGLSLVMAAWLRKGELVKVVSQKIDIPFGIGALPTFIPGFEFWLLYHLYKLKRLDTTNFKKYKYLRFVVLLSIFVSILVDIIIVDRPALCVLILGWFVIHMYFSRKYSLSRLGTLFFAFVIIFVITSILRWVGDCEDISYLVLSRFIGYIIAPYNRLALIIEGHLRYELPKLFYLLPVHKIPLTNIVLYPSFFELNFLYAYPALASAGLNTSYNMATLFGAMYQSLGIAVPVYFAIMGIVGNRLFHAFKEGRTFGIVLYPLFYASVALWIIDVNYFPMMFFYFFYAYLILVTYNAMVKPKRCL